MNPVNFLLVWQLYVKESQTANRLRIKKVIVFKTHTYTFCFSLFTQFIPHYSSTYILIWLGLLVALLHLFWAGLHHIHQARSVCSCWVYTPCIFFLLLFSLSFCLSININLCYVCCAPWKVLSVLLLNLLVINK